MIILQEEFMAERLEKIERGNVIKKKKGWGYK